MDMVAVIASVVLHDILSTSLSSNMIGPLAMLQIVGPVIEAYAISVVDVVDESVILACNILVPPELVACMFCIMALALDGAVYTDVTAVVVGA